MKSDYVLLLVAVLAVVLAVAGSVYTYSQIQDYKNTWFSGLAVNTGNLYLNITPSAFINFSRDTINFSQGLVQFGFDNATLNTAAGTVTGGNWSAVPVGFIIQNLGSSNISLDLKVDGTPATKIGGTNPNVYWNITPIESDGRNQTRNNGTIMAGVSGSGNVTCLNSANSTHNQQNDTYNLSVWTPVQTADWRICDKFGYKTSNNSIKVDVLMFIPRDAPAKNVSFVFTATGTCCIVNYLPLLRQYLSFKSAYLVYPYLLDKY